MEAAERLTIVVTTSPIPSHPSSVLLKTLFASFREHLLGLESVPRLLVCDGYRREDGKRQPCSEEAYAAHLAELDELVEAGVMGPCRLLRLGDCARGYGLALETALADHVKTEFVLVVQHDWLFLKAVDVWDAIAAMDIDAEVKYVGMQSLTTLDYARRMRTRYGIELPESRSVGGLTLVWAGAHVA
eukprot:gnl/TRDRNA2_/TRDRNA2_80321_c0_seq1.p1 gnl/TRDRNA2_/TRDRNA2_80321_c0~~gnl/TRDRNA2_/TRDRNA2_80321_c0_seq1.p1  ORF type:complete len:187 (+),score=38.73 gnl/TRDRNA2_/TRDRNA2_80321_c0_seq1:44-604(+)